MPDMVMTSPACYASDSAFLHSLAFCMVMHCMDEPLWKLEKFWKENVPGTNQEQPDPKESYSQTLKEVEGIPESVHVSGVLNMTSLVDDEAWRAAWNTDVVFAAQEKMQAGFG
jgi:hypothetical protein